MECDSSVLEANSSSQRVEDRSQDTKLRGPAPGSQPIQSTVTPPPTKLLCCYFIL